MKRFLDLVGATFGLILLSPLLLGISLLIGAVQGRPVLFKQIRPGQHGRPFQLIKFRTMGQERDDRGNVLSDTERLTSLGKCLRSTSLDELPELWNVLMGEMSLVGPRPLLMEYLPLYSPDQARRHEVRPGLTGWAQVNGRNALDWEQKFELDVWYVDNQSLWLDLKILVITLKKVVLREGISAAGESTMPRFVGAKIEKWERE